jgi:hypothetical protein
MEIVEYMSADNQAIESREPIACRTPAVRLRKGRSRLSNGSKLLSGIDGRSPWVRRCKDIIGELISDRGGPDNASAAERSIIRRDAVMTVELERMESQFAAAGEASAEALDVYARISANLRRMLEAVGLKRVSRDVTPDLDRYLQMKERAATTIEAAE